MAGQGPELKHDTALQLAHGYLTQIAQDNGFRLLFVKGVAAQLQGLRDSDYIPSDVDAYVDPHSIERLIDVLAERGWRARYVPKGEPRLLSYHSVTMIHENWPIDFDLHYYFPGIFADTQKAFDEMWSKRATVEMAGQDVWVPEAPDHIVLLASNALREPHLDRSKRELAYLANVLREDDEMGAAFAVSQLFLRAVTTTRELAVAVGIATGGDDLDDEESLRWRLWVEGNIATGRGGAWAYLYRFRNGSLGERWTILRRAIWRPLDELRIEGMNGVWNRRTALRAQFERYRRGVVELPVAIRQLRDQPVRSSTASSPRSHSDIQSPPGERYMLSADELEEFLNRSKEKAAGPAQLSDVDGALSMSFVPMRVANACVRRDSGEVAVMPLRTASGEPRVVQLSGSSVDIWDAVDGKRTVSEVVAAVAREFDVSTDTVEADVTTFLARLRLLELIDDARSASEQALS